MHIDGYRVFGPPNSRDPGTPSGNDPDAALGTDTGTLQMAKGYGPEGVSCIRSGLKIPQAGNAKV